MLLHWLVKPACLLTTTTGYHIDAQGTTWWVSKQELCIASYIQMTTELDIWLMFCLSDQLSVDNLAAVQRKVYAARTNWYNLGLELGQQTSTLDSIGAKHKQDPSECFRQVLKEWLKGVNPSPTWRAMVNALKSDTVKQRQLAEQIQSEIGSHDY